MSYETIDHIRFNDTLDGVIILDQTALPGAERYLCLTTLEEMTEAICSLRVRGAPAIGIFAAFSLAALARRIPAESSVEILLRLRKDGAVLAASRPTAVNLSWAVQRMLDAAEPCAGLAPEDFRDHLYLEAQKILQEDIAMCRAIAGHGLTLLHDGDGILTHCNAGPIATSRYGTALGPILLAAEQGMKLRVFADETRPLLQGARLTSWELQRAGVDVTLICDNMASSVMKQGWVQACFVGCDRIAANGDVANKIGTCGVAILAKYYKVPLYVFAPTSTVDLDCASGDEIVIEERPAFEVTDMYYSKPMAPKGIKVYNPAFDITPASLIAGIVTEKGIIKPREIKNIKKNR